jgi:hypothetical protein
VSRRQLLYGRGRQGYNENELWKKRSETSGESVEVTKDELRRQLNATFELDDEKLNAAVKLGGRRSTSREGASSRRRSGKRRRPKRSEPEHLAVHRSLSSERNADYRFLQTICRL